MAYSPKYMYRKIHTCIQKNQEFANREVLTLQYLQNLPSLKIWSYYLHLRLSEAHYIQHMDMYNACLIVSSRVINNLPLMSNMLQLTQTPLFESITSTRRHTSKFICLINDCYRGNFHQSQVTISANVSMCFIEWTVQGMCYINYIIIAQD